MSKGLKFYSRRLAFVKSSINKFKSQLKLLETNQEINNDNQHAMITYDELQDQEGATSATNHYCISSSSDSFSGDDKNEIEQQLEACWSKLLPNYDSDDEDSDDDKDCEEIISDREYNYIHVKEDTMDMESTSDLQEEYSSAKSNKESDKAVLGPLVDNEVKILEDHLSAHGQVSDSSILKTSSEVTPRNSKKGIVSSVTTFILGIILMLIGPYIILQLQKWIGGAHA